MRTKITVLIAVLCAAILAAHSGINVGPQPASSTYFPNVNPTFTGALTTSDGAGNATLIQSNYVQVSQNHVGGESVQIGGGSGLTIGASVGSASISDAGWITYSSGLITPTNYVAANFAPSAGNVILVPSNNWMMSVTTLATNRAFQISP